MLMKFTIKTKPCATAGCPCVKIHAKGLCKRCYVVATKSNTKPQSKGSPMPYSTPPTLLDACKVALVFHSSRTWDQDQHLWPAGYEATTKGLCDFIRAAIAAHGEAETIHPDHELGGES